MTEGSRDNFVVGAVVRGVADSRCVGHFVYEDSTSHYTLGADDREGEPVAVVSHVEKAGVATIRKLKDWELNTWRARWDKRK